MINEPRRNLPQIALLYPGFVQRGLGGGVEEEGAGWRREGGGGEGPQLSALPAGCKESAPTTCLYFYISACSYLVG